VTTTTPTAGTSRVALLRGINVGGRNKVPMQTLRELIARIGGTDARTHLQSGNAVFRHAEQDMRLLEAALEQALAEELGLTLSCLVRSAPELRRVVEANPFPMEGIDGARFLVVFLSAAPPSARLAAIDPAAYAPDAFAAGERVLYVNLPNGIRDSKLATMFTDRRLGVTATARNWNTVTKLLALAES
jgi:uncharacterized protein (DUF1697 family)